MIDAHRPIPELGRLRELQDRLDGEYYAWGFLLSWHGHEAGLERAWSKDPAFLARVIPFAEATGSGSFYAIWRLDDRDDLATLPIVVFGDEGGQHVVARNLLELFQILGYDCEPMIDWNSVDYCLDDEDDERSPGHEEFAAWLDEQFGLAPAADADSVVAAAQAEFGERFASWAGPFLVAHARS